MSLRRRVRRVAIGKPSSMLSRPERIRAAGTQAQAVLTTIRGVRPRAGSSGLAMRLSSLLVFKSSTGKTLEEWRKALEMLIANLEALERGEDGADRHVADLGKRLEPALKRLDAQFGNLATISNDEHTRTALSETRQNIQQLLANLKAL